MRKLFFITIKILLFISFVSCSNEEPLLDNSTTDVSFIIQRATNSLEILHFKNSNNPTFTPIELETYIGEIVLMKKFRDKYYLLNKQRQKIFVLENISAPNITEIDFSFTNIIVNDFCFPNATDCYIVEKSSNVRVIDLTTNKLTNIEIKLSGIGSSIAGIGNQVYVTIPDKNLVEVIDTRTNSVDAKINVSNRPTIVNFTNNGKYAVVIATGDGKDSSSTSEPTSAMINVIDLETRNIYKNSILTGREQTAKDLKPNKMVITSQFIYISATTKNNVAGGYRISASNFSTTSMMIRNDCNSVIKNYNSVLFVENTEQSDSFILFNSTNNEKVAEQNVGSIFNSACEK